MAQRRLAGAIAGWTSRVLDRIAGVGARHTGSYPAALALVAVALGAVEVHFADFEHGTHLLVLLTVVIGLAVLRGPGPASLGLVVGGIGAGATSLGTAEPPNHPDTALQLATYLIAGTAFIVVVWLTGEARRRRMLIAPGIGGTSTPPVVRESLTRREREILALAASGIAVDDIARRLFLSPNTVKTHLTHAYAKLGARGRSDAIRAAVHLGYLTADDICPHLRVHSEPPASTDR